MVSATFNIQLRSMPCQKKTTQRLFRIRVSCPRFIPLPLSEALEITSINGPLHGKAQVILPQILEGAFPLGVGSKNIHLNLDAHRQKETIINFPINIKDMQTELEKESQNLYTGKKIYHNLLVIEEITPDYIKLGPNPNFSSFPQIEIISTAQNIQKGVTTLTHGPPDEAVKDLVEGDLNTALKILAQDHPGVIKRALIKGEFDQILERQNEESLQKILYILVSGILKLEQIFQTEKLRDLYPFLPLEAAKQIADHFVSEGKILVSAEHCQQMDKHLGKLRKSTRAEIQRILTYQRAEMLVKLKSSRDVIEEILGLSLEEIHARKSIPADGAKLRRAVLSAEKNNIFDVMLPSYIDAIARSISEARRSTIIKQIEKSNLLKNVKAHLLHTLANKEYVYISMFSFTDPLSAAASLAAMLRGAKVRILLDRKQAAQSISQYKNLVDYAKKYSRKYPDQGSLEVRIFSGTQHQKNMIFGSGAVIMGSQNLSARGLTSNLEDIVVIQNDRNTQQIKKKEFEELFSMSGRFIPFSDEILSQHWIKRAGITGIRFLDRVPNPSEVSEIKNFFSRWKVSDFRKVKNILEIAQGKRFELEVDLAGSFHPFMAEIKDQAVVHFLIRFLEEVPPEFIFARASSGGLLHPGTTSGLSGLIEHSYIVAELAVKICKILGREDLIDQAILSAIIHDTYKNARETTEGTLAWGFYNPGHGELATKKAKEIYSHLDPVNQEALKPIMPAVEQTTGEHMSIFNDPEPTPLIPEDSPLKWILVFADMLASRKYLHVFHRARFPMEREEILHLLLNNSFSIRGEALTFIEKNPELFDFIKDCTGSAMGKRGRIQAYKDVPRLAKKMLRVAESLCDLFPDSAEVNLSTKYELSPKKMEEFISNNKELTEEEIGRIRSYKRIFTEEEIGRINKRNEILTAALLYGTLRYKYGIDSPESERFFNRLMGKLLKTYPNPNSKQRRILELMLELDKKLITPHRADLSPKDKPELWILGMANCMMATEDTWIITDDEVEQGLSRAEGPKTRWFKRKFDPEALKNMLLGIKTLASEEKEYRDELFAMVEEGLLSKGKLNYRRKDPLTKIHPDILSALVDKFDSLFPSYIYEHFYRPLSSHHRKKTIEKIRESVESEEIRKELIEEIRTLPDPAKKSSGRVFRIGAQTALANGIRSIDQLKTETIDAARNTRAISEYSYFKQMPKAVQHIMNKIKTQEKILIYGDYDVDGLTGTALLVKTLRWIRTKMLSQVMNKREAQKIAKETISYYIPHRLNEGYGLNSEALERIHRRGFKTVITADCGIKDKELVKRGKKLGIDFIVTDHHDPERKDLPRAAVAILNPKLDLKSKHPAYYLPGAAVAYKLARALADEAGINLRDSFLDSVGLAAIADVVPMVGENRAFVKAGLKRLTTPKRNKGLAAIIKAHRLEMIDEEALAYLAAPLLNVAGRLGRQYEASNLLMSRTEKEARTHLPNLFSLLEDRREIDQTVFDDAEKSLEFDPKADAGIAVSGEWHKGIIGLVASKLVAKYGVPSVTIGTTAPSQFTPEEPAYGSMRSIKGVSAIRILKQCAKQYKAETGEELFLGFGGHLGAAGFKIGKGKIDDFQQIYKEVTKKVVKSRREKMVIAGTLLEGGITLEEVKLFRKLLAPFGNKFEEPLFYVPARIKSYRVFGRDHQHIKGFLENGTPFIFFFGNQPWVKRILMQKRVKFVAKLGVEKYKGKESVNLIVEDLKSFSKK